MNQAALEALADYSSSMNPQLEHANLFPWIGFGVIASGGFHLNVVAYRVPRNLSVVKPPFILSCCEVPIRGSLIFLGLVGLYSKGKARCCRAKISPGIGWLKWTLDSPLAWIFNSYLGHQMQGFLLPQLSLSGSSLAWS